MNLHEQDEELCAIENSIKQCGANIMEKTQCYLDTQNMQNILMPTSSQPLGRISDQDLKAY